MDICEVGTVKKATGPLLCIIQTQGCMYVIHHWALYVCWSVYGHKPQFAVQPLSQATLARTNGELRIVLESFIIEINPSVCHKREDNVIITPHVSCFYFFHLLFIFSPSSGHMVCCLCVRGWCVCVCLHMNRSKYSSENPIKGDMYCFAVLFKAFWDISTDISFNVRASGRKQTNLLLLLPFLPSLLSLFYLFSSLSVTLHQSLSHTPPSLHLFPPLIAMLQQDATFASVLFSVCPLLLSTHIKVCIDEQYGACSFELLTGSNCA